MHCMHYTALADENPAASLYWALRKPPFCCAGDVCLVSHVLRDGADEDNCPGDDTTANPTQPPSSTCGSNEFQCLTGKSDYDNTNCIRDTWLCDGMADCQDGSDEGQAADCAKFCAADEFNCASSYTWKRPCMKDRFVCDGSTDCVDGSDESDATCKSELTCKSDEFLCASDNKCIPASNKCDSVRDCTGSEDERDCTCGTATVPGSQADDFFCAAGAADKTNQRQIARASPCIPPANKCNEVDDCLDGADESSVECNTDEGTQCKCKEEWADPDFHTGCAVKQNGCEKVPCDHDHEPWCHVSNPGCAGSLGEEGAWAYCKPPVDTSSSLKSCDEVGCKDEWQWSSTDVNKKTYNGCVVIAEIDSTSWCYAKEKCASSFKSTKYDEHWFYCQQTTTPKTTKAAATTGSSGEASMRTCARAHCLCFSVDGQNAPYSAPLLRRERVCVRARVMCHVGFSLSLGQNRVVSVGRTSARTECWPIVLCRLVAPVPVRSVGQLWECLFLAQTMH